MSAEAAAQRGARPARRRHVRRQLAAACLVLAPAFLLASAIVLPANSNDVAEQVAIVARHPDRFIVADLLGLVAQALLVPAVLGLMWLLRERGSRYGHVGGALAFVGVVAGGVQTGLGLFEWQMVRGTGTDRVQMVALLDRVEHSAGLSPILIAVAGISLGLIVLAAGTWRAHIAPAWLAGALAVGAIAVNVGYEAPSLVVRIAASALTFAALAGMARLVRDGAQASATARRTVTAVP